MSMLSTQKGIKSGNHNYQGIIGTVPGVHALARAAGGEGPAAPMSMLSTQKAMKSRCWWPTLSRPRTTWPSSGMGVGPSNTADRSFSVSTWPPVYCTTDL
jgi:hypothetical protein